MTRKQTKAALKEINEWLDKSPGAWGMGHPDFFKAWRLVWYQKHYEVCLKAGVDPDSVIHYGCIKDGEGTKWQK